LINDADVEYIFTDVSSAFLRNARQRFSDYEFVRYQIYNVEAKPQFEQTFDIVIAANVIHATADIGNSLRNIRSTLSDDGILILREITSRNDFATLAFGVLDGWWRNSDGQRIPNSPMLTLDAWRSFIGTAGFSDVASRGHEDQQVIIAEAG
jgi:polyketide synthase PksM